MNIDQAFPSSFLKHSDLDGDTVFTIKDVKIETLGRGKDQETKPVVYFTETDKGLALNVTNKNTIKGLYGPDTDGWTGKRITLFPTQVEYAGEQVEAIRVKLKAPGGNGTNGTGDMSVAAQKAALGRAWAKFQENYKAATGAAGTPELCGAEWREAIAAYFPGKVVPGGISAPEWDKFVGDNFSRPASPISEGSEIDPASIPF